jgi:hypothetical protein
MVYESTKHLLKLFIRHPINFISRLLQVSPEGPTSVVGLIPASRAPWAMLKRFSESVLPVQASSKQNNEPLAWVVRSGWRLSSGVPMPRFGSSNVLLRIIHTLPESWSRNVDADRPWVACRSSLEPLEFIVHFLGRPTFTRASFTARSRINGTCHQCVLTRFPPLSHAVVSSHCL